MQSQLKNKTNKPCSFVKMGNKGLVLFQNGIKREWYHYHGTSKIADSKEEKFTTLPSYTLEE
jgi:hypothetical protein